MKKKILCGLLAIMLCLTLTGCGDKKENTNQDNNNTNAQTNTQTGENNQNNGSSQTDELTQDEQRISDAVSYNKTSDGKVMFTIKTKAIMEWNSSWLGLCPVGIYLDERAADDADIYYSYEFGENQDDFDKGIYHYVMDFSEINPGIYTMVLTDSDNDGRIIGHWLFTLDSNKNFTLNFKDAELKD